MRFTKGNKAAAKPSNKAVAAMIRRRLERDADTLTGAQFTALVNRFGTLTAKRPRRHPKEPEAKKVSGSSPEWLNEVLQIEAEQRETARKQREAKSEPKQIAFDCDHTWVDWLTDGKQHCTRCGLQG